MSGPGRAERDYHEKAAPVFDRAGIVCDVQVTAHKDHGIAIVRDTDMSRYDGVVSVGGDGLLVEVLQGMLARPDWQHTLATVPVAPLPGGSGNGLVASLCRLAGEKFDWVSMAYIIARGQSMPMDVASVFNGGQR